MNNFSFNFVFFFKLYIYIYVRKIFLTFYLSNITQNLYPMNLCAGLVLSRTLKFQILFLPNQSISLTPLWSIFFIIIKVFRCFSLLKVSRFFQCEWMILLLPWKCLLTLILLFLFSFSFFWERKVSTLQLSYYCIGF